MADLDDLISRAGSLSGQDVKEGTAPTTPTTPTAPSTNGDGDVPHMIDGEVVSTEDVPPPNTKDN